MNINNMLNDYEEMGKKNGNNGNSAEELRKQKEEELQKKIDEACRQKDKKAEYEAFKRMPLNTMDMTLNDIKNTWSVEESKQVDKAIKFVYDFNKLDTGLYLYSKQSGTGKTTLASAIARAVFKHQSVPIFYGSEEYILSKIRETYQENSSISEDDYIKKIAKNKLVVIDELGQNVSDWSIKTLKRLLDEMMNYNSILVVTSNYGLNDLAIRLLNNQSNNENRTVTQLLDRLKGMTEPVKFGDKSFR
ncbi:ATP-binding protein [Anaerococcus sp. Marseille-P3625]|uniref:ATP-binding protein n=1 Tax=Anaerococcus sp. Marseille-P3625 TaxID=1977277 RepID=UPI000C074CAD|nr:ATP-binding protein [Anaerococcus sp. Marseille-P3625]